MTNLEMQVNALMRLCTAEGTLDRQRAAAEIKTMMGGVGFYMPCRDPEMLIRDLLLELGAPDHLVGHPYTVTAVQLVVEDRTYIDSITFGLYPQVAAMHDTTASRVERAIRHLVEVTWSRGDLEVLNYYFGNTVSAQKGKPTNGEFIARLSNIVKQRMKECDLVS